MIELVADHGGQFNLLLWKEQNAYIKPYVQIDQKIELGSEAELQKITYEPQDLDPTFRRAIRFPSRADSFGSTSQLLDEICGIVKKYTNLADNYVLLAAHSVLASWFMDATNFPVALVISGPPGPQGQRLFHVLSCFYRHALLLSEISLVSLCSLPMDFSPSLFIERCDYSPQFLRIIRATRTQGYIPARGKLVSTRCATVICSEELPNSAILGWNAVEIPVTDSPTPLEVLGQDAQQKIADEFQSKLLMYRLQNYTQVMNSTFDATPLTSVVNELARCLGACVVGDSVRQANVIQLLKKKDEQFIEDSSWDMQEIVSEALLALCHKKKQSIHAGEVAAVANSILESRGEWFVISARAMGNKLRDLEFMPRRIDSGGRGILLTAEVRKRIHRLACENKLQLQRGETNQCADCNALITEAYAGEESEYEEPTEKDREDCESRFPRRYNPPE